MKWISDSAGDHRLTTRHPVDLRRPAMHQAPDLIADAMTARHILDHLARLARHLPARVVVDVTNAWSIPWTAQPIDLPGQSEAFVACHGIRQHAGRTEAVYEITG